MTRLLFALLLLLAAAAPPQAQTQQRGPAPARPAEPPQAPSEQAPPYEAELLQLAEIMGSLAYLRTLCEGAEAGDWRARMAALIEAEGTTPARRERLTSAYNRGFRAYALTHRFCAAGSREAAARLGAEGERLSRALAGRYGG